MKCEELVRQLNDITKEYITSNNDREEALSDLIDEMSFMARRLQRGDYNYLLKKEPEYERD